MVDVLALVLLHDEQLVERAITEALQVEQLSKQHVLNCLGRLSDPAQAQAVSATTGAKTGHRTGCRHPSL